MRLLTLLAAANLLLASCANQTSPTGGPQDKKPPVLLKSIPKDNQRNFVGKTLELEFDEYVQLKNANEEVMITPSLGKKSKIIAKKNRVIISPEKALQENTTYTVNFRDAVQDLNERNPVYNLRLAFSTGSEIDSLRIAGTVSELFKEQPPDKITVALYQSDTFKIFQHIPTYFTRTNTNGQFDITNLKAGRYYIYAFDDKNRNLRVDSKTERFGFIASQVVLNEQKPDSVRISLFKVDARPLKLTSVRNTDRQSKLRFNKALDTLHLGTKQMELPYQYNDTQDEVLIYDPPTKDSLQVHLFARDSVGHTIDTTVYIKTTDTKLPKETFTVKFAEPKYNLETKTMTVEVSFNKPLLGFSLDSLYIQLDTTQFLPILKTDISIDPLKHRLRITKKFQPIEPLEKKQKTTAPIFIAGRGAFISVEEDSAKSYTTAIKVPREEETGTLAIQVTTNKPSYTLELLDSKNTVVRTIRNSKFHTFKNLTPDEYKIRIITDKNANGKWDVGNYETDTEPEPVFLFRTIDKKFSTPVRANWEVGPLSIKF
ncbi:MAG: Ig-like domain-containing protein [Cytophagales bacterium]